MTSLQLIGLAVGIISLGGVLYMNRRGQTRGSDIFFGLLGSMGLIAISLEPDLAGTLRDILALEKDQFSRLIAILIFSNILLWAFLFHSRTRFTRQQDDFESLVFTLALSGFELRNPELKKFSPITIIIPSYNEEKNISAVLKQMPKQVCGLSVTTLVVDDGSQDKTLEILRKAGHRHIRLPINRGGGAALRAGFEAAKRYEADIVVTMDADGQHLPAEIESLVKPIVENKADFVIGSRFLGQYQKDSRTRLIGIHVFNWVIRLLTPIKLTDCSNGMRAIRLDSLTMLKLRQNQYHTPEVIIQAVRHGLRITETPVTVKIRASGKTKKGKTLHYGLGFARSIIKTWWR